MKFRFLALGIAGLSLGLSGLARAADHASHAGHAGHGPGTSDQAKVKKPKHAQAVTGGNQSGRKTCPPGLAKKNPGCLPPGQWKKGDRLPESWAGHYTSYNNLPQVFRERYANRTDRRFVYQDNRVVVIDAVSRAVVDILTR